MSVSIITYNNKSANNVIHKSLTQIESATCEFYGNIDIKRPVVILIGTNSKLANYAYVADLHRYYYIESAVIQNDGRLMLYLNSDPLMSFWDEFKNSPCVAKRSSSNYDPYLVDEMISIKESVHYSIRRLNGSFAPSQSGANHYVLTIGGMNA